MISADCHLDLIWLPPDLFTANASAGMRDRMPYVTDGPKGPVWVTKKGASLGHVNGMGSAGREYVPGRIHRADRMASTGLYEDGKKGIRRLSDPDLRLLDQDRDGVQAEVLYVGVLERYPRVRVVLGEAGIGWIPYILWRMDGAWEDQFKDFSLTMPPSEYRRRQCWATYQTDPVGLKLVDELGADRIMWGSDFPHPDGIWPDSREYIAREMAHLSPEVRHKIVCGNAAHLFTRERFAQMQRHAILINVTRGEIVRGEDVLAAVNEGLIWGAGLDVTDPEPLPKDHPLWRHPRVIVTPHTAGGSPRRAGRVIATFCENLRRLQAGRPLLALIDKQKGY